jgi:hypothetical protein
VKDQFVTNEGLSYCKGSVQIILYNAQSSKEAIVPLPFMDPADPYEYHQGWHSSVRWQILCNIFSSIYGDDMQVKVPVTED